MFGRQSYRDRGVETNLPFSGSSSPVKTAEVAEAWPDQIQEVYLGSYMGGSVSGTLTVFYSYPKHVMREMNHK